MKYIKIKNVKKCPEHWDEEEMMKLRGKVLVVGDVPQDGSVDTNQAPCEYDTVWNFLKEHYTKSTKKEYDACWKKELINQKARKVKEEKARKVEEEKEKKELGPLFKAFKDGDWGCQEESVKNLLIVLNKILKKR